MGPLALQAALCRAAAAEVVARPADPAPRAALVRLLLPLASFPELLEETLGRVNWLFRTVDALCRAAAAPPDPAALYRIRGMLHALRAADPEFRPACELAARRAEGLARARRARADKCLRPWGVAVGAARCPPPPFYSGSTIAAPPASCAGA